MATASLTLSERGTAKNGASEAIDTLIPRKTLAELTKIATGHEGDINIWMDANHIFFEVGKTTIDFANAVRAVSKL